MKHHFGLCEWPECKITIDSSLTHFNGLLAVMAHEMIHLALEQNAASDHDKHDENFNALAGVIEQEMGWKKGVV